MSDQQPETPDKGTPDQKGEAPKSTDRAKLSVLMIGTAFFSLILCMCISVLVLVAL